jgi:hypothetical protein
VSVPVPDPTPAPSATGDAPPPRAAEAPAAAAPEADPAAGAETDPASAGFDAESEPVTARNPFRVALIVLGIVLVAVAAGLVWQLAQPSTSTSDPNAYIGPQIAYQIAPPLALGGLVSIIAAIAVGVARRR